MVTDQEFFKLQKRIDELEKTVKALSISLTEIKMVSHARIPDVLTSVRSSKRDKTRYVLDGKKYSKRAIVLAGIKMYIRDHKVTSSSKLFDAFPQDMQGSLGTVRPIAEAELYENARARFYFGDDDVLKLEDGIFVVCKEWTTKNISDFLNAMANCGYVIYEINR